MVGLIESTPNLMNKCPTIGKSGNYICTTCDITNTGGKNRSISKPDSHQYMVAMCLIFQCTLNYKIV